MTDERCSVCGSPYHSKCNSQIGMDSCPCCAAYRSRVAVLEKVAEAAHEHRVTTMIIFHEYLSDLSQKDLDKIIDTDKKLQAVLNSRRAKEG